MRLLLLISILSSFASANPGNPSPTPSPSPHPSPSPSVTPSPTSKPVLPAAPQVPHALCDCPAGYVVNANSTECVKTTFQNTLTSLAPLPAVRGNTTSPYSSSVGHVSVNASPILPMHFGSQTGDNYWSANGQNVLLPWIYFNSQNNLSYPDFVQYWNYWTNRYWGPNNISIRSPGDVGNGTWYSKSVCLNAPATQNYVFSVGADNRWAMYLDGTPYAYCHTYPGATYTVGCHQNPLLITQQLTAGSHVLEIKYMNQVTPATSQLWLEVYSNTATDLLSTNPSLTPLFSTQSLVNSANGFDYSAVGPDINPLCPTGFFFDVCGSKQCKKVSRVACNTQLPKYPVLSPKK